MHYAAYAGSNNDDEDYSVSCEDTWHCRWKKCGSCFFPASLQHHPNSLQRHPKCKTSKDLCQESLSPVSNWDLVKRLGTKLTWMRFPRGFGFLCGRSQCGSQPLLFASAALPKTALSWTWILLNIPPLTPILQNNEYTWNAEKPQALTSDLFVLNYDQLLWPGLNTWDSPSFVYMATTQRG